MVFEKLQNIIASQFGIEPELVTLKSNIIEDFDADSLDIIDLVMSIEDEFEIAVPDEELEKIGTVADMVRFLEEN
ncbi:MAG: acyl carrier protein [Acutalibacteraceae bacterium]